ncbi:TolC family protein [Novosphingopyxis sp.]|uniref:TolC family protein n=1 Tax=Novosphingopyxis sp. TaxID=2709690 RepID=UPI003B5AC1E0
MALPALLLASCATYAPVPLGGADDLLAPPSLALLSADAKIIDRPFLTPTTIDFAAPLDGNAVAVLAVLNNPDLKAMRARAGVKSAQAFAAGLLPDPSISAGFDHILSGPDPVDNLAAAFGFDLNALRTRHVLVRQARAEERQVRLDLAWAEWQKANDARTQAVRASALERQFDLLRQSRASAQSLLSRTLDAAGRGDYAADKVQAARQAAFDITQRYQTAEADLAAARYELTRLLGLPPEFPLQLAPPPPPTSLPPAATLFTLALERRTDLAALKAGYAAQEAATRKAVLDQFPNLTVTANASRDTGNNKLLGPAIDLSLPLWNRNRGGIAIERATREALRAEYDARIFQTRAEIAAAREAVNIAEKQRLAVLDGLPALERFAAATRRAANRGDLALATAETAEQAYRDQQLLLAQTEQQIAENMIMLEQFSGAPRETWP